MTAAKAKTKPKHTTPKAKRKEKAKAEEFIEKAKRNVPPVRKASEPWVALGLTADDIVEARDKHGLSWRDTATKLGLANPGQARKAYAALTGKAHNASVMTGRKARRGTGGSSVVMKPKWDNDSDPEEITEAIKDRRIIVEAASGPEYEPEEIRVKHVRKFLEFGKSGRKVDLAVELCDGATNQTRTIRVQRIIDVR
jgi:hypothetical protein